VWFCVKILIMWNNAFAKLYKLHNVEFEVQHGNEDTLNALC